MLQALATLGFDAVYETARAAEVVSLFTDKLLREGRLETPVISCACPVVVRLIRTRFPGLIRSILPVLPPVEVAARLAKRSFCRKTGCRPEEVGAVFLSPCPAKSTASRDPLGFDHSEVDLVVAIKDIYPSLLAAMKRPDLPPAPPLSSRQGLGWALSGGEAAAVTATRRVLAADGIENIIRVLEDLEDEKITGVDFVELTACPAGCVRRDPHGGKSLYGPHPAAGDGVPPAGQAPPSRWTASTSGCSPSTTRSNSARCSAWRRTWTRRWRSSPGWTRSKGAFTAWTAAPAGPRPAGRWPLTSPSAGPMWRTASMSSGPGPPVRHL